MKKFLFVFLLFPIFAFANELEVIDLKHRSAEDLLPIIRPMLDKDGVASGMNYQLILRTSPRNLADIRKLLQHLDTAPRRLKITVMQEVDRDTVERLTSVSGTIGNNPRISVADPGNAGASVEIGGGQDRLRARIISTRALEDNRKTQQLQVLEGNRALVRSGQSMPVTQRQVIQRPWGTEVVDSTEYREVNSGFYVLPRVNGDRVTLEISTQNDAADANSQSVSVQHADTTLSGQLGDWMELGGIGQQQERNDGTISSRSASRLNEQRSILIKVEELK